MATQNIDTAVQGSNLSAAPAAQTQSSTATSTSRLAAAGANPQSNQGQTDSVRLSPEAVHRAALEQQTQQPSSTTQAANGPDRAGGTERQAAPGATAPGNPPPPAETPQEDMAAQAAQRIETDHTIQNYTNASLYTQVNGKKIDENV